MPCNDWPTGPGGYPVENPINKEMKKRLDNTTRLLCALLSRLDNKEGHLFDHSKAIPGLSQWWRQLQEEERRRADEEDEREIRA